MTCYFIIGSTFLFPFVSKLFLPINDFANKKYVCLYLQPHSLIHIFVSELVLIVIKSIAKGAVTLKSMIEGICVRFSKTTYTHNFPV